jgi:hypothetical protein
MSGESVVQGRSPINTLADGLSKRSEEIVSIKQYLGVTTGWGGQSHNRNINAASSTFAVATNTATWATPVHEVAITPIVTTTQGTAVFNGQACLVIYDAPSDAVAIAWMADIGNATSDIAYDIVFAGTTLNRLFTSGISRIDVLPIGTGNTVMRVLVAAV